MNSCLFLFVLTKIVITILFETIAASKNLIFFYVSAAGYCHKLKQERVEMQKESEQLKQEIESLNSAIRCVVELVLYC